MLRLWQFYQVLSAVCNLSTYNRIEFEQTLAAAQWIQRLKLKLSLTEKKILIIKIETHCFQKRNLMMHVHKLHKTAILVKLGHILC